MNQKLSYLIIAFVLLIALVLPASAQMGIGTTNPHPSAAVDIVSTTQGVLHPRLTTAQRNAISSPAEGLTIYNTTDKCLQVWNGTAWNCAVGGGSGGSTGGGIPNTTMTSFPLLSVAAGPAFELQLNVIGNLVRDGRWSMTWIDAQRFAFVYRERQSGDASYASLKFVVKIFDERLRDLVTYQYTSTQLPGGLVSPIRIFSDVNGNLIIIMGADGYPVVYFMAIDPNNGGIVHPVQQVETPTPLYPSYGGYDSYLGAAKLNDGSLAVFKSFNVPPYSAQYQGLYRIDSNYDVTGTAFQEPSNYAQNMLAPTSFGYIRFLSIPGAQNRLNYSVHNNDGTFIKSVAPVTTDPTSELYSVGSDFAALTDGDALYILTPNRLVTPQTSTITKLTVAGDGTLTTVWKRLLPLPADDLTGAGEDKSSAVLEMNPDGNLMINLKPIGNTPTGFYQDGTLYMNGLMLPVVYVNATTGAIVKTVTVDDSPGAITHWGEGRREAYASDSRSGHQFFASTSGQRMVHSSWNRVYAGTTFLGDWYNLSILDPLTLEDLYALSNDGVAHRVAKHFMVYDFNENINKVEIVVTNGLLGDQLDIDPAITLPSGMSKAYSFSQKKLTITGSATNTAANFQTVLNGLTFATDAGTGERTLEAKIFDSDSNQNTTTFTLLVAN